MSHNPSSQFWIFHIGWLASGPREETSRLNTRPVAKLGAGSRSHTGGLVTTEQSREGIAGLVNSSILCAKTPPSPSRLLSLSTAAVGTARTAHIWCQVLLVPRQNHRHLIFSPITKPEAAFWIVQDLPLQQEQEPAPACKPSVQHSKTASRCARGWISSLCPQR